MDQAAPDFHFRCLGKVRVKGKIRIVSVYECFDGDAEAQKPLKIATHEDFNWSLSSYLDRDLIEAASGFKKFLEINPEGQCANFYLKRAANYLVTGVPDNWKGIVKMEEK